MQLENFFESLSYLCIKILPLIGVILGIYLIIMVHRLIQTLKSAEKVLDEANTQIRKLDVPLNTVAEISKSVDHVHDLAKESINQVSTTLYLTILSLKQWFQNLIHKDKEETEVMEKTTSEHVEGEN